MELSRRRRRTKQGTLARIDGNLESIHILVAKLFLPQPGPGQTKVYHRNGTARGNAWRNLRRAIPGENNEDSNANGDRKSNGPKRSKKVRCRKVGTTEWRVFDSGTEATRVLGLNRGERVLPQ